MRTVLEMTTRSKETTKLWLNHGRQVTYRAASMLVHNFISRSHEVPKGFTFHYEMIKKTPKKATTLVVVGF